MISQNQILRFFKDRKIFNKYFKYLKEKNFPNKEGWNLLQDFAAYYDSFSDEIIDFDKFQEWFFQFRRPDLPLELREDLKASFQLISEDSDEEFTNEALKHFKKQQVVETIQELITTNNEVDLEKIKKEISDFEKNDLDIVNKTRVDGTLAHIDDVVSPINGIKWHLKCLQDALPAMGKGIFGVIAARPGRGKSSMLASFCANAIRQTELVNIESPILWLNNENAGERSCYQRLYCSYFNLRWDEIKMEFDKYDAIIKKNRIVDRVICHDIQGKHYRDVELFIQYYKPSLLILDMIDNLKGFDIKSGETSNTKYERMYQWALELSSTESPIIATSQLNKEADGMVNGEFVAEVAYYPSESNMKGSSTDKQAAASFILMIGSPYNYTETDKRFLSAPRNKYGEEGWLKQAVVLDKKRARFIE